MAGAVLTALVLSFLCGRVTGKRKAQDALKPVTHIIYHTDTITSQKPVYFHHYTTDTIRLAVRDTIRVRDTLYISVPREVREYRDTNYYARVSGYDPALDYIETYQHTKVVTATIVQERKLKPRWSVGLTAGYGIGLETYEPIPFAGVGITYNFLSFGYKK